MPAIHLEAIPQKEVNSRSVCRAVLPSEVPFLVHVDTHVVLGQHDKHPHLKPLQDDYSFVGLLHVLLHAFLFPWR